MPTKKTVAIIGAGFSGTVILTYLIKLFKASFRIVLIEKTGFFAQGVAFSTKDKWHFLNVRTNAMSAFEDDRDHFYRWLLERKKDWEAEFDNFALKPETFAPRKLYGMYLERILEQALEEGKAKGLDIELIADEVVDVQRFESESVLHLQGGLQIRADRVVLATSLPPYKTFHVPSNNYYQNIWGPEAAFFFKDIAPHLPSSTRIALIGTGLTMVDVVVSLIERGYRGGIAAISKNGCLPEPHGKYVSELPPPILDPHAAPLNVADLVKIARIKILEGEKNGVPWQASIASLRPVTSLIWQKLSLNEQRRFVRYVLSHWNKYRHRVPDEIYNLIQECRVIGVLKIHSGNVVNIETGKKQMKLHLENQSAVRADIVLNCSGPEFNLLKSNDLLYKKLLENKLVSPHPLEMGIRVNENFRASQAPVIYAVGQLLFGQLLETTAIPEIRSQCKKVAQDIANG